MLSADLIFLAYAVTIVSETIVVLLLQRPREFAQWLFGVLVINSFTHPIAVYLIQIESVSFFAVEAGVILTEAVWYKFAFSQDWERACIISVAANITSILCGIMVRHVMNFPL